MIDSVAGAITLAMPTPWMKNMTATTQIGVLAPMNTKLARPTVVSAMPVAHTALGP